MLNTCIAHSYAINKHSLTMGIYHGLQATSHEEALTTVQHEVQKRGYTHARITHLCTLLTENTGVKHA
ncbi:hypothetical protein HVD89_001930 [Salmonella enterica]|nr:hypothetical protein [Salmonella enterica]